MGLGQLTGGLLLTEHLQAQGTTYGAENQTKYELSASTLYLPAKMSRIDVLANIGKHADVIFRVCSYHRRDFVLVVTRPRPHDRIGIL